MQCQNLHLQFVYRVVIVLSMEIVGQQPKAGEPKQFIGGVDPNQGAQSNGHEQNGGTNSRSGLRENSKHAQ